MAKNNLDRLDQSHAVLAVKMRRLEEAMVKARKRDKEIASLDDYDRDAVSARFPGINSK